MLYWKEYKIQADCSLSFFSTIMTVTKRPLPPTPSTGNNNNRKSVIDMNYENAHYNDLLKSLEQKEVK